MTGAPNVCVAFCRPRSAAFEVIASKTASAIEEVVAAIVVQGGLQANLRALRRLGALGRGGGLAG
jgi:hypothetical protein